LPLIAVYQSARLSLTHCRRGQAPSHIWTVQAFKAFLAFTALGNSSGLTGCIEIKNVGGGFVLVVWVL